jgi:hypothetical protein
VSANPELRRNLWLEATPARLVLIPIIVGGLTFLAFVSDGHRLGAATALLSLVSLGVLTWGWGAHLASESVLVELRGRTWDWQRMSGLGGWSLTWGKLAGATAPAWYGAAFCLLVYALATPGDPDGKGWMAALVVLVGVLVQAGAFFAALHAASRGRVATRGQSSLYLVGGALVVLQLVTGLARSSRFAWYGLAPTPLEFGTLSAGVFAAFVVVGAWVRVRRELRLRTLSLAWPAFLLFVMLWAAGFAHAGTAEGGARPLVAFLVAVAATWLTALLEPKDPVALRRLVHAARDGRWRTLAEELPPWLLALPFVLGAWLAVAVAPGPILDGKGSVHLLSAAIVLFLVRDLAVIVWLSLGPRPRRADLLAVVLLAVGYVLVPLVLSASGLRGLAAVLFPDPEHAALSAVAAPIQAVLALALLAARWRERLRAVQDRARA